MNTKRIFNKINEAPVEKASLCHSMVIAILFSKGKYDEAVNYYYELLDYESRIRGSIGSCYYVWTTRFSL